MKLKFRADAKDVLIFVMFAIFLLYIIALGVINLAHLKEGDGLTLIPFEAFTPDYIVHTLVFYFASILLLFCSFSF